MNSSTVRFASCISLYIHKKSLGVLESCFPLSNHPSTQNDGAKAKHCGIKEALQISATPVPFVYKKEKTVLLKALKAHREKVRLLHLFAIPESSGWECQKDKNFQCFKVTQQISLAQCGQAIKGGLDYVINELLLEGELPKQSLVFPLHFWLAAFDTLSVLCLYLSLQVEEGTLLLHHMTLAGARDQQS
jgi:hypothetical protein